MFDERVLVTCAIPSMTSLKLWQMSGNGRSGSITRIYVLDLCLGKAQMLLTQILELVINLIILHRKFFLKVSFQDADQQL